MSRPAFYALALLVFAVSTLAIGIRGVDNWANYELGLYVLFVGWIVKGLYDRYVTRPDAA